MKAAFVTLSVSRRAGGLFDCMRRLGQELMLREGTEVDALGLDDPDAAPDFPTWAPVRAHTFAARSMVVFKVAPEMTRRLDRLAVDVVHTHGLWSYASVAANAWQKNTGGPTVVSPHGMLDPWALGHSGWKKRLAAAAFESRHLRGAACVHALCAAELEAIRGYGLTNPVCVIPNGVDLPDAPPEVDPGAPWKSAVPNGQHVLLYLGRLHPKKGLVSLLRAWAALRKENPARAGEWTLVIAGWDQGDHAAELKTLAAALAIEGSVHFAGPLFDADKHAAYRHADAFVLPSVSEGLPLVVLEAWSHGLPVVMTPACNLPEGFAAGAALESGSRPEELTAALATLVGSAGEDRRRMGERGRALVVDRFTWTGAAAKMAQVYRWVSGKGERPDCVSV